MHVTLFDIKIFDRTARKKVTPEPSKVTGESHKVKSELRKK